MLIVATARIEDVDAGHATHTLLAGLTPASDSMRSSCPGSPATRPRCMPNGSPVPRAPSPTRNGSSTTPGGAASGDGPAL